MIATPSSVATAICMRAPGIATLRTAEQVLDVEVQPDAEHQQDHAELGELLGEPVVRDEARGEWSDRDAREQIADDRRQPERWVTKPKTSAR